MATSTTPSTSTTKPNLSSSGVQKGMSQTGGATVLLQTYTNTVLQTPIIHLDPSIDTLSKSTVVESLPKDQQTAKNNALYYLNTINPLIIANVAQVIGFANLWKAEYNKLLNLAQNIDVGTNSVTFTQGINNLIKKTTTAAQAVNPVLKELNNFLPLIQTDASNFNTDANNVSIALGGESGAIDQLQKEISAYNDAMSKDLTTIALGATADIVGGLMIAVGVLAEFETAGLATGLVIGGLAMVAGGTTAMGIAGHDYSTTKSKYANALTDLAKDKQVYALTGQAAETIKSLVSAVSSGISAVETLQGQWTSLGADFQQVIDQLNSADPDLGDWLVDMLNAANSDWMDTLSLAESIQQYGTLPVTTSNDKAA